MIYFMIACLGVSPQNANFIQKAAAKHGLSLNLFSAVLYQESLFTATAVNSTAKVHSYGMGQLTADTALAHCKLQFKDIFDTEKNINCSAKVLAYQMDRYYGNPLDALSAYNAGTSTKKNWKYVSDVLDKAVILEKGNACGTPLKLRKRKLKPSNVH